MHNCPLPTPRSRVETVASYLVVVVGVGHYRELLLVIYSERRPEVRMIVITSMIVIKSMKSGCWGVGGFKSFPVMPGPPTSCRHPPTPGQDTFEGRVGQIETPVECVGAAERPVRALRVPGISMKPAGCVLLTAVVCRRSVCLRNNCLPMLVAR